MDSITYLTNGSFNDALSILWKINAILLIGAVVMFISLSPDQRIPEKPPTTTTVPTEQPEPTPAESLGHQTCTTAPAEPPSGSHSSEGSTRTSR